MRKITKDYIAIENNLELATYILEDAIKAKANIRKSEFAKLLIEEEIKVIKAKRDKLKQKLAEIERSQ